MNRYIWSKTPNGMPVLRSGMVVQYSEPGTVYLLTHFHLYSINRTLCLNTYSKHPDDYGWPNPDIITKIWDSLEDYYKDKFGV